MFDPIKFFTPSYLFDLRPYTTLETIKVMLYFFTLLVIIGIALKIFQQIKKLEKYQSKLIDKLVSFFIILGALGIGLTWCRYERAQIFSSRFWLVVWLIVLVIWLYTIIKYWLKTIPEAKKRSETAKLMSKYLPGKK